MSQGEFSPQDQKKLAEARASRRAQLREAYQRIYNNPFRTNAAVFDPVAFRYEAARAYMRDFYRITPKSLAIPLGFIGFAWFIQHQYSKQYEQSEKAIKSGENTYYERAMWRSKYLC